MFAAFVKLLNMSAAASILIAVVVMLRLLLRKAPKKYICLLWAIAALRLVVPVSLSSAVSAYNYIGQPQSGGQIEYVQYDENSETFTAELPLFRGEFVPTEFDVQPIQPDFYLPTAMLIWAAGFAGMLCYASFSYLRLRKQTAEAVRFRDNIYRCDHLPSPFILGILMPKIYLPSDLQEPQRRSVIAHEQAHIRRLDHWWKPMGFLILSIHWFNPLVWVGYALLSRDIETACDERVISKMSAKQKQDYSETLLQCSMPQKFISACPLAFGETGVKQRIRGILNYRKPTAWIVVLSLMICMCAAAAFLTDPVQAEATEGTADIRYELEIGAEDVVRIAIDHPNGSAECTNADGSAFKRGDKVWLKALDNMPDLANVTFRAYTGDDTLVWSRTIREDVKDAAVFFDAGWSLLKHSNQPKTGADRIISYGPFIANYGDMIFAVPLKYQYNQSAKFGEPAAFIEGNQVIGGTAMYSIPTAPKLPDMRWVDNIAFPEQSIDGVYFTAEGVSDSMYIVKFSNYLPEDDSNAVRTVHNLYYWNGSMYDLWFDELKTDENTRTQIRTSATFHIGVGSNIRSVSEDQKLIMYSSPSEASNVLAVIAEGEEIAVLREEYIGYETWVYGVSADEAYTGWVKLGEAAQNEIPQVDTSFHPGTALYSTHPLVTITMYSSPDEFSPVVAVFGEGEKIILEREEKIDNTTWCYGTSEDGNVSGWVNMGEELPETPQNEFTTFHPGSKLYSTSPDMVLTMYSSPSEQARVIAEFHEGEVIIIRREEQVAGNLWIYGSSEDGTLLGWVMVESIDPNEELPEESELTLGMTAEVKTEGDTLLNVRKGPGLRYPAVDALSAGTEVDILETVVADGQKWGRIGDEAWICMEFVNITVAPGDTVVTVLGTANLRTAPSVQSKPLTLLEEGEEVTVIRTELIAGVNWDYVSTSNQFYGWVEEEFLSVSSPEQVG